MGVTWKPGWRNIVQCCAGVFCSIHANTGPVIDHEQHIGYLSVQTEKKEPWKTFFCIYFPFTGIDNNYLTYRKVPQAFFIQKPGDSVYEGYPVWEPGDYKTG